ncbi:lysozyme 2-like [Cylas formicarius]|uniref:lysozyme 2-like n=1 Tax=Cylas formicarius TaxID=197179 RepID=UPI002958C1C3|nr:lysozyme 2-like [Cylas formicarius]
MRASVAVLFIVFGVLEWVSTGDGADLILQNLNHQCLRCLCHVATGCDLTMGCVKGYCGPYKISKIYWKDADEVTLPDDDKERAGAYEDCAISYNCAQKLVVNYMSKYGRDCNGDGVTNCEDYMMINFNGGVQCQTPMNRSEIAIQWVTKFKMCNPLSHIWI